MALDSDSQVEAAIRESLRGNFAAVIAPTYSKSELEKLANGIFLDDPRGVYHADKYGTFKNDLQYNAMTEEEKKNFPHEFKNSGEAALSPEERLQMQLDKQNEVIAQLQAQILANSPAATTPDATATKAQLAAYLTSKGVDAKESETKEALLAKVASLPQP